VAIKIVQRYSKRRRLGRLGDPEDKVKKEVAILKKARHPNVVSLLEVIDDPNRQKVYIVLEFIENGEIKWRKKGIREIVQLDKIRMERDKNGIPDPPEFEEDGQQMVRALQHKRRVKAYQSEKRRTQSHSQPHFLIPAWSLEHGGESDDELGAELALARTASRNLGAAPDPSESHPSPSQSYTSSTSESDRRMRESVMAAVEGSMYGPYVPDYPQERRYSAASSLFAYPSSDAERFADDDDMSYVPCLTIEEARNAFRDAVLGLEYLHYQGIIHRDIKPANLLVTFNCQVKISDFGVSYLGRPIREEDEEQVTETDATELDDARGELSKTVGTPAFYAPELCYSGDDFVDAQGRGPKITAAIDIWSLGVTLYGMIFGRLPFVSDDEYSLFQSIGKNELFIPSKRLKPVEVDPAPSMSEHGQVMNSNKRLDEEFKYEEIDHTLRDLLARLLAKDPQRRITIKEIKEHPWVREGLMEDPDAWAKQTDPQSKGNRIEVSNEEVTSAVSKVPFVDRVRSQVAKWSGYIVGRREKRTPSAAGSTTDSATSKDSREGRRASLRGDEEIFRTPKGHRESDHPLSQSVTASPLGLGDRESSFNRGPRHGEPTLTDDQKQRPPERVSSAISTAESTKTVTPWPSELAPFIEPQSHPSTVADTPASNHLGALFSGSGHRPGKDFSHSGPHHGRSRSLDRASVEGDVHSEPSLAISAASATGRVQTPSAWNDGGHHHAQYDIPGDLGHRRGRSSQSTRDHSTAVFSFVRETLPSQANPQHQDIARGDHITHLIDDEARSNGRLPADNGEAGSPSPQDNGDGLPSHRSPFESTHHVPGSGFTTSPPSAATISTTSMDEYASEMSQSASHPSIPSVISGASSLSADGFQAHMKEREKESDTPYVHPILRTGETITAKNYTGQPLHEEEESRYDCDDEDGDSEDEGIVFGKKKQAT
jgi:serine/threonine protein kinase